MKKLILLIAAGFVWTQLVVAQRFSFKDFGEKDGLRNNIIFSFIKDSHGYLWIGTQNGLNRFDGAHFNNFKKTKDPNSLPNNSVHALCEDKNGNIWGGTDNGIFSFSLAANQFTNYNAPANALSNIITNIICDKQGDIYTAGIVDLMKFNKEKKRFEVLASLTQQRDSVDQYAFGKNRLLKDEAGNCLWVASLQGIICYDLKKQKLLHAGNSPGIPLFAKRDVAALTRSSGGEMWFFDNSAKAIIRFDPQSKKETMYISLKQLSPQYRVSTILEDSKGKLWLSSWNNEFFTIDLHNENKIGKIEINKNTTASLFFWAALEDENGSIWLGTLNGISICSPDKYTYRSCQLSDKIPELKDNVISSFEENPLDKSWWILTAKNLIIQYHPETGKYNVYHITSPDLKGIGITSYTASQIAFLDNRPVVLTPNGVWRLQPNATSFTPYRILPEAYADFHIQRLIETDSVYYFTDAIRLLKWNKITRSGNWIPVKNISEGNIGTLEIKGLLWKPNQPLFWAFNKDFIGSLQRNGQTSLIRLARDTAGETKGYFHASDIDNEGNIWINNKGVGLYRYQPRTGQLQHWAEFDGLPDNHFHSIKADDNGNVWMLYFNKAVVFSVAKNSFINFSLPYSENFFNYYNWSVKRSDGTIMGSIANELFEFNAGNLNLSPLSKSPHLSVINVSGKDHFITTEKELVLKPDQNSVQFRFGFMADGSVFPHQFEYKLDGVDKDWVKAEFRNEAVYNNLSPGKYVFHLVVKGRNNSWQSSEKIFTVIIQAPFYKTIWFRILVILLVSALIIGIYRNRLRNQQQIFSLETKAQELEKEKTVVLYESLKQQLNPHFLFNSLTSLSGLIESNQQLAGDFLKKMSRIYRYILKSRDSEVVTLREETAFVQVYIDLQKTRFTKGFEVNIRIDENEMGRKIPPVTLQNLVENAIKHNIIDAETPLVVDMYTENGYLIVKNNLQKKHVVETSNKQGLTSLLSLYRYLSEQPVIVSETEIAFIIKLPLL